MSAQAACQGVLTITRSCFACVGTGCQNHQPDGFVQGFLQAGQAAGEAAHTFGDAQSFLEEFFPGRADELRQYQDGPWLV